MALQRIADFEPNYKEEIFAGDDIKGFDVYAGDSDEKVGTVYDALVDETGRFRYLVVDTGIWIFGKKVLLPIGSARFDYGAHRVYATGLRSKAQAEQLPAYNEMEPLDYDREEQVRGVYRTQGTAASTATPASYDRSSYSYDIDRPLYETNEQNHQNLKLYEERLIANKNRAKTGEVAVGKRVETETARASVPIEKERVVIERVTPVEAGRVVSVGEADFQSGEVARIEVYEETADIHKEAYVREEVNVRKEVVRSTVDGEETLRREELDIQTDGTPVVDNKGI
ncbi:MAG: DUF2382 domain-containing protein [Microcoleus sp. PH2017_01_SCD_O_A]|uniref:DUF2382 domain-containing protein n=1 Tax=Microcoleus sp. PH2017_01_SCD_O_A TaxID=2798812 RepID=UPI001D8DA879|nr:DUF2382 domain-containing protein [Microcoleus sp. PH2017_01_SCD_O_A]MCC3423306.1 DUF2382 domain-containing protein [Microcoleus sp. PH2017_01_SCD_O_A]TAG65609.1 MAG: DUF2382 domain-containing protein [Oscillatoriales cyanobacterium]